MNPSAALMTTFSICRKKPCSARIDLIPSQPCSLSDGLDPESALHDGGSPMQLLKLSGQCMSLLYFDANAWWKSKFALPLPESQTC